MKSTREKRISANMWIGRDSSRAKKYYRFSSQWPYKLYAIWIIGFILIFVGIVAYRTYPKTPNLATTSQLSPRIEVKELKTRRFLDGVFVAEGKENPSLAMVLIENMVEAQPISGVADASIIFEAPAEANITRFLAIYPLAEDNTGPEEIGPVRSARPYFLDWAGEFGGQLAHVGGSPGAIKKIRIEKITTLDQWYKSEYFWRSKNRPSPHNVYTSFQLLAEASRNSASSSLLALDEDKAWKFKDDAKEEERGKISIISVNYPPPYEVLWRYDGVKNEYDRYQWNGIHKTAEGKEISAKNIAVVYQKMEILDAIGRRRFTTLGEGNALIFQDGKVIEGKWKKSSSKDRTRFYDQNDTEISFNAGVTWVEIVPTTEKVEYN